MINFFFWLLLLIFNFVILKNCVNKLAHFKMYVFVCLGQIVVIIIIIIIITHGDTSLESTLSVSAVYCPPFFFFCIYYYYYLRSSYFFEVIYLYFIYVLVQGDIMSYKYYYLANNNIYLYKKNSFEKFTHTHSYITFF